MSTTMPLPTTWPASDVPAALGISDIFCSVAKAMSALISAMVLGIATASGFSWYSDASVA